MSTTAQPIALPGLSETSSRSSLFSARTFKITVAAAVTIVGAYGVMSETRYVSTSSAVVTAYVLNVRTPIAGDLADLPLSTGQMVQKGQLLGRVNNPLSDHQRLQDLQISELTAQSEAEALTAERDALETQRKALLHRAGTHTHAMSDRIQQQVAETLHTLAAREQALSQAKADLARGTALSKAGVIARADFEKIQSSERILVEEVSAERAALSSIQAQAAALTHGILSEPGTNNDVAYSQQRADEISIKLAENARALGIAQSRAREAHAAASSEATRDARLTASELRAPASGLLWKLNAINGEHTAAGSEIISMVDCHQQFLLAEIPQERLSSVVLNGQARIRFTGDSVEHTGTVLSVSGDPQRDLNHKLAAVPVGNPSEELATVVVGLDASDTTPSAPTSCLVGRTGRVRIPSAGGNLLSRWISDTF